MTSSSSPRLAATDPLVCVLRHDGQPIYRGSWGGSLYLHNDEWHVYLPGDGGDPTMHAVLDDAVKRLAEGAFAAGRESVWADAETEYRVYHAHHNGAGRCFVERYATYADARESADWFAASDPHKTNHWVERTEMVEREVPLNA